MNLKRFIFTILALIILIAGYLAWDFYQRIFAPNVSLEASQLEFFVHSDWTFDDVRAALEDQGVIDDASSFEWVAERKQYPSLVKPGRYVIFDGMNNNQLINLLRSGAQEPIKLVLRSVRTKAELASNASQYIEADSAEVLRLLNDPAFCAQYGFTTITIITLFLPNTYEFYWSTSPEEFIVRMAREYKRYWTDERIAKARSLGLSQSEVSTLASIVQAEQGAHPDERPIVAGLYLNRIRKGMRLESDPTLIHAIGDFTIKRVLNVHKQIDSPYNTYKNSGLPPGPILLPEISSIDAVLDPKDHNYIFMCAKEDFSGYHNFSSSYRDHINNAKRYQRELNKRRIYK
ncbi:MAG: endolytic transglycosylase MltG [Flavobacteriales bacterium]|nr:endolytic transglycosylase MltG [Flavobacteriales bacterium]